jgi:hypothetical protein
VDLAASCEHHVRGRAAPEWERLVRLLRRGDRLLVLQNQNCRDQLAHEQLARLVESGVRVRVPAGSEGWTAPTPPVKRPRGRPRKNAALVRESRGLNPAPEVLESGIERTHRAG